MSTSRAKREARRQEQETRGAAAGKAWAESAHPVELDRFVRRVGEFCNHFTHKPWKNLYEFPALEDHRAEGKDYLGAFSDAAREIWRVRSRVCSMRRVHDGFRDGCRWAEDHSTSALLSCLEAGVRKGSRSFTTRLSMTSYSGYCGAHDLVAFLLGDEYPLDEEDSDLIAIDCAEFREFWEPFVEEPMDDFLASVAAYDHGVITHKLADPHYVEGFVAGALSYSGESHKENEVEGSEVGADSCLPQ